MSRAREAHVGAPRALIQRLTLADEAVLAAVDQMARTSFSEASFSAAEELSRPWARLWAARFADEAPPVGYLVGWHVADELHVLNVATVPEVRRRGVGRALMEAAIAYAASERARIVLLEVRRSNRPAIKLYRAFGFTALGVRPSYYADNDEDAIEMILGLDPDTGRALPGHDEIRIDG